MVTLYEDRWGRFKFYADFVVTTMDNTVSHKTKNDRSKIENRCRNHRPHASPLSYYITVYLEVPASALKSNVFQLILNFVAGTTTTRSWIIKIAMLPCDASYLEL